VGFQPRPYLRSAKSQGPRKKALHVPPLPPPIAEIKNPDSMFTGTLVGVGSRTLCVCMEGTGGKNSKAK
jgi:hypothetical protein